MLILALDTATDLGTVALVRTATGTLEVLAEASASVDARHGETLMPHLTDVLTRAGCRPADLELIAVGIGPGSFTGVRVGLSAAKGLAIALEVPVVGVGTLDVIAHAVPDAGPIGVLLDAKKDEVFFRRYGARTPSTERAPQDEPRHATHAEAVRLLRAEHQGPLTLVGSGARDARTSLAAPFVLADAAFDRPRASVLAAIAAQRLATSGPSDHRALVPLYVRGADAIASMPIR